MKKKSLLLSFRQISLLIFLTGLILGILLGITQKSLYINSFLNFQEEFKNQIAGYHFSKLSVMRIALLRNLKYMGYIIFFAFTPFFTPFFTFTLLFCGTYFGLLLSAHIMSEGIEGIATLTAYLFPQILLLLPVFYFLLKQGYYLSHPNAASNFEYDEGNYYHKTKKQLFFSQLPKVFLLFCLLFFASFLEGYLNIPFLKMMLRS